MQIRMTVGKPLLMSTKYIEPLYQTFMLGLPFAFREANDYPENTTVKISITGNYSESWILVKQKNIWIITDNNLSELNSEVTIPEDIGWIIFTNTDRDKGKYYSKIDIKGNYELAQKAINMVTVMS